MPAASRVDCLTALESEIVSLVGQGYRERQIVAHLTVSRRTVEQSLRSIFQKLGVSDKLELAVYAHQRKRAHYSPETLPR